MQRRISRDRALSVETLEDRALATTVLLLSGDAFASSAPSLQTRLAAADLARRGFFPVQLSYSDMTGPAAFERLANQVERIGDGQPIGIVGFSAGGTLALRLAGRPSLNVKAALDFYGPPDLSDWLRQHAGDAAYRRVVETIGIGRSITPLMSGPMPTTARLTAAFGMRDRTVIAMPSAQSFQRDFPTGTVYFYPGPHGVQIYAKTGAYEKFVSDLS